MRTPQADGWTRRRFLGGLTLAGTAELLGLPARPVAAEPPPETTTLRIFEGPITCNAPPYAAQELTQAWPPSALDHEVVRAVYDPGPRPLEDV
jgi:NitT/TauT family transport system substrate-binding protein